MSRWTLDRIVVPDRIAGPGPARELPPPDCGHSFSVTFYLTYRRSAPTLLNKLRNKQAFQETPKLEWQETITMKESGGAILFPRFWTFQMDMYRHNPSSLNLITWRKRYILAYGDVAREPAPPRTRGFVNLRSPTGRYLTLADLRVNTAIPTTNPIARAEAVRDYIAANGCQMIISLEDRPSISSTGNFLHKERLTEFNIGLRGIKNRIIAYQKLDVQKAAPQGAPVLVTDQRDFQLSAAPTGVVPVPGHYAMSDPPVSVEDARDPLAVNGEYD